MCILGKSKLLGKQVLANSGRLVGVYSCSVVRLSSAEPFSWV